jgi:hypothetical protein
MTLTVLFPSVSVEYQPGICSTYLCVMQGRITHTQEVQMTSVGETEPNVTVWFDQARMISLIKYAIIHTSLQGSGWDKRRS